MFSVVTGTINAIFVVDLVGLLRWRQQKRQIPSVLTSLLKIDGEEIVKVILSVVGLFNYNRFELA